MKKLYAKSELGFDLARIGAYVVLLSMIANGEARTLGTDLLSAAFLCVVPIANAVWPLRKRGRAHG